MWKSIEKTVNNVSETVNNFFSNFGLTKTNRFNPQVVSLINLNNIEKVTFSGLYTYTHP